MDDSYTVLIRTMDNFYMELISETYTVFLDGELYTNVIDDINSHSSWAWGGMIFLHIDAVNDFVSHLRGYNCYKDSKIEIKRVMYG